MPKLGTFNLHASLLPQYRGAAPINWAVINGESRTGATTFMIDKQIDTGGIILRQDILIGKDDTAGDIHDKLMGIGAEMVVQTAQGLIEKMRLPGTAALTDAFFHLIICNNQTFLCSSISQNVRHRAGPNRHGKAYSGWLEEEGIPNVLFQDQPA